MSKNENLSLLDIHQMSHLMFDEKNDAQRVILVGGDGKQIADSIKESLKDLKIDVNIPEIKQQEIQQVEPLVLKIPYQTVVKELEIKEIEKIVFVPEVKIVEIEKPIIVTEVKIIEVEKTVIVKELEHLPNILIWLLGVQTFISFVSLVLTIIHK